MLAFVTHDELHKIPGFAGKNKIGTIKISAMFNVSGKTLLAMQAPPDTELLVPQPELHTTSLNVSIHKYVVGGLFKLAGLYKP